MLYMYLSVHIVANILLIILYTFNAKSSVNFSFGVKDS